MTNNTAIARPCAGCKKQIDGEAVSFTPADPKHLTLRDVTLAHTKWHVECLAAHHNVGRKVGDGGTAQHIE